MNNNLSQIENILANPSAKIDSRSPNRNFTPLKLILLRHREPEALRIVSKLEEIITVGCQSVDARLKGSAET